jgi:hypothetical protein
MAVNVRVRIRVRIFTPVLPSLPQGSFLEGCDDDSERVENYIEGKHGGADLSACGECDVESVPLLHSRGGVSRAAGWLLSHRFQQRTTFLRAAAALIYAAACVYGLYRHMREQTPHMREQAPRPI